MYDPAVRSEIQLFMSQNFHTSDYYRKEGMHVTVICNTTSAAHLSEAKPYPLVNLPISDEFEYETIMWSMWHVQNVTFLTLDDVESGTDVRIPSCNLCAPSLVIRRLLNTRRSSTLDPSSVRWKSPASVPPPSYPWFKRYTCSSRAPLQSVMSYVLQIY